MPPRPVPDMKNPQARLDEAIADLTLFRERWNALGRPLYETGSKRQVVPHPLVKMIRDAERAVAMLSQAPGAFHKGGRPVGAESSPDRRKLRLIDSPPGKTREGSSA